MVLVFIGSQVEKGRSAEPNALPGERTISFPADYSMGKLSVRDWNSTKSGDWTVLSEARGEVTVPAGKELRLKVPSDYSGDFSPLSALEPSDLQSLVLDNTKISDTGLAHIRELTTLHKLCVGKTQVSDTGLEHIKALTKLQDLNLVGTKVSKAGIRELKRALPNCSISEPVQARRAAKSRFARRLERLKDAGITPYLLILIIGIVTPIVCLITAVFLRFATKWAVKFKIPYWPAYKITLIAAVVSIFIRIPFNILATLWAELLELVVYFLVHSAIYGKMIKHAETKESIGFGKGMLITLYVMLIWIVLACVVVFSIRILILAIPYI